MTDQEPRETETRSFESRSASGIWSLICRGLRSSHFGPFITPHQANGDSDMKMTGVMSPDELTGRSVSHQQVANLLRNHRTL